MIKFRLYIPPVILGFVIVPLLVWPTVIALAVLIFTLTFLAEIIFSFPLLVVRISLQELQLELLVEYALFFSVMCGIGWQFSRRTPPELKNRLHCWLVFSPVYFWLILSNFILYISPEKSALLENIRNTVTQGYADRDFSVNTIADATNLSPAYVGRLFKRSTGITLVEYILEVRMDAARTLLTDTDLSVTEIVPRVGFGDAPYFYKVFKKTNGCTPAQYRANQRGLGKVGANH